MSKCEVVTIGSGDDAIVVNKDDYENDFPLNENIKKAVKELESGASEKAEKAKIAKAKKAEAAKAKKEKEALEKAAK